MDNVESDDSTAPVEENPFRPSLAQRVESIIYFANRMMRVSHEKALAEAKRYRKAYYPEDP